MKSLRIGVISAIGAGIIAASGGIAQAQEHSTATAPAAATAAAVTAMPVATTAPVNTTAPAVAVPSCRAIEYPGNVGKIAVQTSGSGYVAWGVNMYNPADSAGKWDIDTFVNGKKTTSSFHRVTGVYIPHGAVPPKEARRGAHFHVEATVATASGIIHSVPNDCIIP